MAYLLLILINLLFPVVGLGVILFFLVSPRRRVLKTLLAELQERFGLKRAAQNNPLWLHAASVGEVRAIVKFAEGLKQKYNAPILITANTAAGKAAAQKESIFDFTALAPLDFYPSVKNFIRLNKPQKLFIIEADLWPNMITACALNAVPVAIVNGRMSARGVKRYGLIKLLFSFLLNKISLICAQAQPSADNYIKLGAAKNKVFMTGNIKYDMLTQSPKHADKALEAKQNLGWQNAQIITCGSTHPEEEDLIISAAKKLPKARFIIAPRHLERKLDIITALVQSRLKFAVLSRLEEAPEDTQILLADAMGFLGAFYSIADICFIGGTIAKRGGHNLLEAAILKKPLIIGPSVHNTPDVAAALLEGGGAITVGKNNFAEVIKQLLNAPDALQTAAQKAYQAALSFKGATQRTLQIVQEHYDK